jgi:hypothetical protein
MVMRFVDQPPIEHTDEVASEQEWTAITVPATPV